MIFLIPAPESFKINDQQLKRGSEFENIKTMSMKYCS